MEQVPETVVKIDPSPFDAIKQTREDGSEFWSARDLMEPLGYSNWQNFERVIADARRSTDIVGTGQDQFTDVSKLVPIGSGATRAVVDVELTRYGAYMTILAGDGRKPAVAEAKDYFANKTRFAELVQENPALLSRDTAPESTIAPIISVHEIGTLYDETMDEFKRVVSPETVDTPTAHNLSASLLELTKSMTYLVVAGTGIAVPQAVPAAVEAGSTETEDRTAFVLSSVPDAPAPYSPPNGVSVSAKLPPIAISEDAEEPLTWAQFASKYGVSRCGPCAHSVSIRVRKAAEELGLPRGRTVNGRNVFPRKFWEEGLEQLADHLRALHADHVRNHYGNGSPS